MKNLRSHLFFLLLFVSSYFVHAQDVDFTELGKRIATICASIKPGDVVVIYGGKHMVDLREAVAIEVQKQGGLVSASFSYTAPHTGRCISP